MCHVGNEDNVKFFVCWYDYAPADDTVELLAHIPEYFIHTIATGCGDKKQGDRDRGKENRNDKEQRHPLYRQARSWRYTDEIPISTLSTW